MQQRYYDPQTGRFLSVDPVEVDPDTGGNFNRYWYANDNPYRYTDPDGRMVWTDGNRGQRGGLLCQQNKMACENALAAGRQPSTRPNSASSKPAGQCDLPECDEIRRVPYDTMHQQAEALKKAGLFAGKIVALDLLGRGTGRIVGKLGRFFGFARKEVSFGRNANQMLHTFRHVESAGLDSNTVRQAILADLRSSASHIQTGVPFNQTIDIGGRDVTYTAYKLQDGSVNVGRITTPGQ